MAEGRVVNGNANKIAMSRALGAAFLHHQVEQLEKSVSSGGPTGGNWRDRRGNHNSSLGAGKRGSNPPGGKSPQKKKLIQDGAATIPSRERAPAGNRDFDRSVNTSPSSRRISAEEPKKEKDADIVVVDGSVLIHALYQVKKWCKDGREEILIVPLEALNTLDILKKGTSSLAQKARAASRILEAQVGTNRRIRVQRDDAFVLWDKINIEDAASTSPSTCPEWVRRIVCCARWELENPQEELKDSTKGKTEDKKPALKVVLAVLSSIPNTSPQINITALSAESPVPLPAPTIPHATRHEPRSTGILVSSWASRAGVTLLDIEPAMPGRGGGEDDDRFKRSRPRRPSTSEHTIPKTALVERPPAVMAMMEMVSQPSKVVRVLARGEKLDP
ncbi:hypothetical protein CPB83DRAFT_899282 [Crepidotus variabilis]|uniref:PIN domain-containing protein n=1 Tax=Crepidotus variabilis TaxID=179855 RepID=A0A9P6JJ34_9AGAR|nr:hypothetical protein CPB83DRAFT_899282 [Crepidotus variabilis]